MRYIYQNVVQDGRGNFVPSASVTVTLAGGSTKASIYSALTGGTVDADGIITTGADGTFAFYVDEADYSHSQQFRIVWSKSGFTSETWDYIQIFPDGDRTLLTSSTVDQGDNSIVGTLAWHVADASTDPTTIKILPATYLVSTSIIIAATMTLEVKKGAVFTDDASNATLTINGNLEAGLYQIFDWGTGTGKVDCSANTLIPKYYPEWFGATGDGTTVDDTFFDELIACYPVGAKVALNGLADYRINTAGGIDFTKTVHLTGPATFTTGTTVGNAATVTVSGNDSIVEFFSVTGDLHNAAGGAYDGTEDFATNIKWSLKVTGDNVITRGVKTTNSVRGIVYSNLTGGSISDCEVVNTSVGAGDGFTQYGSGIALDTATKVQVYANEVVGHTIGILLRGQSDENDLYSNHISDNDNNGVYVSSGDKNNIYDNYIDDWDDSGIKARGSYNNIHTNRLFALAAGSGTGIVITGSGAATGDYNGWGSRMSDNTVKGDMDSALRIDSNTDYPTEWSIQDNTVEIVQSAKLGYAIQITAIGTENGVITGNNSSGHSIGLVQQADTGKYLDHLTIANNSFSAGTDNGIQLQRVRYSKIIGNNCADSGAAGADSGIYMSECTYNHIAHNDFGDYGAGVLTYAVTEVTSCDYNYYHENNVAGVLSTPYTLTGANDTIEYSQPFGAIGTMTGNEAFAISDGHTFHKDGDGARNFDPTGTFTKGWTVTLINTGGETITFDSGTLNQAVATTERAIFQYNGTAWVKVYLGS